MRMKTTHGQRRGEHGNVLVFVTLALIALFGFAAWSTETGQAWSARGQLQAASDSAALAGAGELLEPNAGNPSDPAAATAAAQAFGLEHQVAKDPVDVLAADIETGRWNLQTRTFTPLPGSTDPQEVRAVRVMGRRDDTANGPLPTVLGRIMGVDSIPISTEAIAYIGYAGLMPPGTALLPIALDCCQISGATCDQSYCEYVQNDPPKPCQLTSESDSPGKWVSCLEFASSNGEQNACWTELDSVDSSINVPGLNDIIEDGNPVAVGANPIYVDNGTKTATLKEISDRFHDQGQYSSDPNGGGSDTNNNGKNDSWVVPLPIVECQYPGDGCAGGSSQRIVGVACFDIQEVSGAPDKILRGEFVCPGDPRWDASKCSVGFGPGGEVPTIDAQYPVLVD